MAGAAVSCWNHTGLSPLAPRIPPSSRNHQFKTLELKFTPLFTLQQNSVRHHCKFNPNVVVGFRRRSFKSFLRNKDSQEPQQIHESKSDGKAGQRPMLELNALIGMYKEAVYDNNEEAVSEIEAMLQKLEKEKIELFQKVAALSAEIASGKERSIRLQADFENHRKQSEKKQLRLTTNAQEEVIGSLLTIVDKFEKTKRVVRPQTEKEKKIDTSYQGIYKQFVETMRSLNVSVVETVGKPFDPLFHEAVGREESQQFKEGIVMEEIQRGFLLRGRVLKPALVKVSKGSGLKKAPNTQEEAIGQPTVSSGADK
ncbi:hypothetical protein Sjap_021476 [Stephania japonica]|uniref:GrpE protein homolog n=1 Tax=Stephania japonica TaxID=461633 RepID=A0AAP0EVW0_9MAGN